MQITSYWRQVSAFNRLFNPCLLTNSMKLEWLVSEHKGQGSDTTGCVNTVLVICLPEMPGCWQYCISSKWQFANHLSKLHELTALMSHLNDLVSNNKKCTLMNRYQAPDLGESWESCWAGRLPLDCLITTKELCIGIMKYFTKTYYQYNFSTF